MRLDSQDGPVIATLPVTATASVDTYTTFTANVSGAKGVHDLYICFSGTDGDNRLDYWQFK